MKTMASFAGVVLALAGCATVDVRPNDVSLELDHASHVSQHFGADPTNYGYSAAALAARWDVGRANLTVAEGIVLDSCERQPFPQCGGLAGGREIFQARLAYSLWSRP